MFQKKTWILGLFLASSAGAQAAEDCLFESIEDTRQFTQVSSVQVKNEYQLSDHEAQLVVDTVNWNVSSYSGILSKEEAFMSFAQEEGYVKKYRYKSGREFYTVFYYPGDNQYGLIFPADSSLPAAEIRDGDITCVDLSSSGDIASQSAERLF